VFLSSENAEETYKTYCCPTFKKLENFKLGNDRLACISYHNQTNRPSEKNSHLLSGSFDTDLDIQYAIFSNRLLFMSSARVIETKRPDLTVDEKCERTFITFTEDVTFDEIFPQE